MTPSDVTVIIVNYNGGAHLAGCLQALATQTIKPSATILVDNDSTDGSAGVAANFPDIELIRAGTNLGFAAANNLAVARADTSLIALLNPDAYPAPNWLEALVSAAHRHPSVSAFGSRQLVYEAPGILDGTGDIFHCSGLIWRRDHGRQDSGRDTSPNIFSPCACAALYRRNVLTAVGGFDEQYFCYVEDLDLGFRMRLAGHVSRYVPEAVVHHVGSATSGGPQSDFAIYHGHRNLVWTFVKNMPHGLLWPLLPLHLLLNAASVVYFALRGKTKVILRSKKDALLGIPAIWAKRRRIQATRRLSAWALCRSIDWRLIP